MNCQNLCRIVDCSDLNELSVAERAACEAHAKTCRQCGPHWVAFAGLAAIAVPPMPVDVAMRCEALAAIENRAANKRTAIGRVVLIGGIVAVAAAAAMFAEYERGSTPQTGIRIAPVVEVPESLPAERVAVDAAPQPAPADSAASPPAGVVLLLDPLELQSQDAQVRSTVLEYYDTLANGLRAIPGLVVVQPDQTESTAVHADFRLTVTGAAGELGAGVNDKLETVLQTPGKPAPGKWQLGMKLVRLAGQSRLASAGSTSARPMGSMQFMATGGNLPSLCGARQSGDCRPMASRVELQLNHLRLELLPNDLEFRRSLRATVLDASQSFSSRFEALELLSRKAAGDMDAPVIRAALDLIERSPHPYGIQRLLEMLRGHADPMLLSALIDMAYQHPEAPVRAEALSMLIDEYKSDPAARSAIESLAVADRMPLLAHVAGRAISGDGKWNEYVLATVKDSNLTPSQRFAPLAYLMQTEQKDDVRKLLDDEVIAALKGVLPGVAGGKDEESALFAIGVMAMIPDTNDSGAIDLMLAVWDGAASSPMRTIVMEPLLRHRQDPRVRGKLEEIAASDANPQLRERAAAALQSM